MIYMINYIDVTKQCTGTSASMLHLNIDFMIPIASLMFYKFVTFKSRITRSAYCLTCT